MIKITDKNEFEKEIGSGVVIVDFFAEWCGPCKMIGPILEELSAEMDGKAKFLKVDVDKNAEIANTYDVSNIPTMLILKDGIKQEVITGFLPKKSIEKSIENVLMKNN
ncbi:thioredoxin [Clostridium felsineum]|uniref:thioredoxin n=1 Tax=Clostridium felsineum TaxID=36839 RepID=UPI00098CA046|nr:Thioredoxin [Clostridium felsineum DSM 794]